MTNVLSRLRLPAFAVGIIAAVYLFFGAVYHMGVAHAAVVVGDPTVLSTDALDSGWNLISTYGWTWGGMYLVFTVASWLLKRNEVEHWIAQGKALAYIVGGVGIGVTVIQAKMTGAPWSGVAMTVVVALFKLINPTPTAAKGAAVVLALALVGGALGGSQIGCSGTQRQELKTALWNCSDPVRSDAVSAVTPLVVSVIKAAGSADGKLIDYSTVKAAVSKANLLTEGGVLLSCAAASAFAILIAPQPTVPGSAASAPFVLDPAALRAAWVRLKAEQMGDAKFVTAAGVM